jgi:DNA polymerase-3 subunit beta
MRFLIGQSSLQKLVTVAQGVVPRRSSKPILMHLLLEADRATGLTISATDEELAFVGKVEAQVERAGRVAVSARDLYDIVRNLPDQPVELRLPAADDDDDDDDAALNIRCGAITYQLQTMPADEYPQCPQLHPAYSYDYAASELAALIDRTLFATSQEETRFYLGGVYLECNGGEPMRAVATDGHRLALAEAPAPAGFKLSPGQILPRKLLTELRKVLETKQGDVRFGFQDRRVLFSFGSYTLISLLVDGTFPDYRQIIPRSSSISLRIPRIELLDATKRISLLSPEKMGSVRFSLADRTLTLSSKHSGRGKGKQEVEVREGSGTLEAAFNAKYLVDALQVIDTADVLLELTSHLTPCLVRPYHEPVDDAPTPPPAQLNIVMPMRL